MSQDNLKSIAKMMAVLDCFSTVDRRLSVAEIARRTRIPRGTAHRIIRTMREFGLLEQEREREEYSLGMKLFDLGTTVLSNMDLHREAKADIEALTRASDETVHLSVFDGRNSTVVHRTDKGQNQTNTLYVLDASPAHATASGKAALAFQEARDVDRLIAMGLRRLTPSTITDGESLRVELAEIRNRGYAIDNEELTPGTRCIASPIRNGSGRVFAAISVSGPIRRITPDRTQELSGLVMYYADAISERLGYRPENDAVAEGT